MKYLPLKLSVGVVLLFAAVIAICFLWTPVKYRLHESRLASDDADVRKKAIAAVISDSGNAVPYIRRWLKSDNEKLVIGSCEAIKAIKDEAWKIYLPELEGILDGLPSDKTDLVAEFLLERLSICKWVPRNELLTWQSYADNPNRKRNICIYLLKKGRNVDQQRAAVFELWKTKDSYSVKMLLDFLRTHPNPTIRVWCANRLSISRERNIIDALFEVMKKDESDHVRRQTAFMILWPVDPEKTKETVEIMLKDSDPLVREIAAASLFRFENESIIKALQSVKNSNNGAMAALAWTKGNEYLLACPKKDKIDSYADTIIIGACLRNGDISKYKAFYGRLGDIPWIPAEVIRGINERMPEGFPAMDPTAKGTTRWNQASSIFKWIMANEGRLAWDGKVQKYYLKSPK